jgi:hypothetical protein
MKTKTLVVVLFVVGMGCKKDNDKAATCQITSVVSSGGNFNYTITYNDEGKVAIIDAASSNPTQMDFSYNGSTVYIITLDKDGHFSKKDSITIDSKGKPLNIRTMYAADGSIWENNSFEYNGDDLKSFSRTTNSDATPTTTTATYSNGNPVALVTSGSTSVLEFYTDKKVQKGDYLEIASLIQHGISIYPHKNLVKTIAGGGTATNFAYEFNSDGLITKVTATSGTQVSILLYTYECK